MVNSEAGSLCFHDSWKEILFLSFSFLSSVGSLIDLRIQSEGALRIKSECSSHLRILQIGFWIAFDGLGDDLFRSKSPMSSGRKLAHGAVAHRLNTAT